jgi:hypothetical protein
MAETEGKDEGTPIHDELETAHSYKVDVSRALERQTDDGKGDEDPGPSDWNGYATNNVEKEGGH